MPKKAKPSAAARPSAADMGSSWVSPDNDNPTRTLDEEGRAEHSGQAKRNGEGWFGVFPGYGTTQHARAQKKAKRSGQAERSGQGGSGVSPDYDTTERGHA
jgi:hypothetical protein